ncbi:MAG: TylF/MycF/NovP-related O-methyltransferase [Alphaproteobacteria bacterium]
MLKRAIRFAFRKLGFDLVRCNEAGIYFPPDFEDRHRTIVERVKSYTVTSNERIYALIEAVRHILANDIPGDFVECGVYKGGSMMTIALALLSEQVSNRELYLFDTFEGMPKPDERDLYFNGVPAIGDFNRMRLTDHSSKWLNAPQEAVRQAMSLTGYPDARIHYVKGLVEDTIPTQAPRSIALLRLDTDWYQSTKHEIDHLYQRVSPDGIVIIDDYGHFRGSRQAVDEFFQNSDNPPFLHRIDYSGRLIIKPSR